MENLNEDDEKQERETQNLQYAELEELEAQQLDYDHPHLPSPQIIKDKEVENEINPPPIDPKTQSTSSTSSSPSTPSVRKEQLMKKLMALAEEIDQDEDKEIEKEQAQQPRRDGKESEKPQEEERSTSQQHHQLQSPNTNPFSFHFNDPPQSPTSSKQTSTPPDTMTSGVPLDHTQFLHSNLKRQNRFFLFSFFFYLNF